MQIRPKGTAKVIKVRAFEIPSNSDYNGDTFFFFIYTQPIAIGCIGSPQKGSQVTSLRY